MSLLEQIKEQHEVVIQLERQLDEAKGKLAAIKAQRINCKHVFSKPYKGYEHEGGYCTECGVNQVYAESLQRLKQRTEEATSRGTDLS